MKLQKNKRLLKLCLLFGASLSSIFFSFNSSDTSLWSCQQSSNEYKANFDPMLYSFKFGNDWKNYGFFESWGLCGGMVLTALDFFYAGCPVSRYDRPTRDSVLFKHILYRQFPLSATVVPSDMVRERLLEAIGAFLGPGDRAQNNEVYEAIKKEILSGKPVPIGLVGETGQLANSHVVLGYELNEISNRLQRVATINVYDPNRPNMFNSVLRISWALNTNKIEAISLTGHQTKWVEIRIIPYQKQPLPDTCENLASADKDYPPTLDFNVDNTEVSLSYSLSRGGMAPIYVTLSSNRDVKIELWRRSSELYYRVNLSSSGDPMFAAIEQQMAESIRESVQQTKESFNNTFVPLQMVQSLNLRANIEERIDVQLKQFSQTFIDYWRNLENLCRRVSLPMPQIEIQWTFMFTIRATSSSASTEKEFRVNYRW